MYVLSIFVLGILPAASLTLNLPTYDGISRLFARVPETGAHFRDLCEQLTLDNETMIASTTCKDKDGKKRTATLDIDHCVGLNDKAQLMAKKEYGHTHPISYSGGPIASEEHELTISPHSTVVICPKNSSACGATSSATACGASASGFDHPSSPRA